MSRLSRRSRPEKFFSGITTLPGRLFVFGLCVLIAHLLGFSIGSLREGDAFTLPGWYEILMAPLSWLGQLLVNPQQPWRFLYVAVLLVLFYGIAISNWPQLLLVLVLFQVQLWDSFLLARSISFRPTFFGGTPVAASGSLTIIVTVSVVVLLALVGPGLWLWVRKRQRRNQQATLRP